MSTDMQYVYDVYDGICLNRRGSLRVLGKLLRVSGLVLTCHVRLLWRAVQMDEDALNNIIQKPAEVNRRSQTMYMTHEDSTQHNTDYLYLSLYLYIYNQNSGSRSSTRSRRLLRPTEGNAPSAFYISPQPLRPGEGGPSPFYIIPRAIFAVSTHVSARSRGLAVQRELSTREARARF